MIIALSMYVYWSGCGGGGAGDGEGDGLHLPSSFSAREQLEDAEGELGGLGICFRLDRSMRGLGAGELGVGLGIGLGDLGGWFLRAAAAALIRSAMVAAVLAVDAGWLWGCTGRYHDGVVRGGGDGVEADCWECWDATWQEARCLPPLCVNASTQQAACTMGRAAVPLCALRQSMSACVSALGKGRCHHPVAKTLSLGQLLSSKHSHRSCLDGGSGAGAGRRLG